MSHATCTRGNRVDSRLLMVESQIGDLIIGPSFGQTCVSNVQMDHASPF
jgi:hypothetical protein